MAPGKNRHGHRCAIGKWIPGTGAAVQDRSRPISRPKIYRSPGGKYPEYPNVEYLRMDMSANDLTSSSPLRLRHLHQCHPYRFAGKRINFSSRFALHQCRGELVLVVPSLESKLYTQIIADRWNVDDAENDELPKGKEATQRSAISARA